MWVIQFLGWLVELLKVLANRSSLHVTAYDVHSYDTSDADFFFYPVTGWEADVEVANRGLRRTTVTRVTLVVGAIELESTERSGRQPNLVFDAGDARRFTFYFTQHELAPNVDRFELRIRDAFGRTARRKGMVRVATVLGSEEEGS